MTEAHLSLEVRRLARIYGIRHFHLTDSRTAIGGAGFPDWLFIGNGIIWRELKSPYGDLETAQRQWKYALRAAGQDWDIWRPVDLESGRIAQELQAIAR